MSFSMRIRIVWFRYASSTTRQERSAIGSGFAVGAGLFATNFHVISDAINEPGKFRLEYVDSRRQTSSLAILDVDVVHDLAIVSSDSATPSFFTLGEGDHQKGSRIYSMGNPLDLGMTIIEGTYSGLLEESLYEKILFSGSLNPGMSGGPAIDHSGSVIGVNVSTAGNEISFLVPSSYLQSLLDTVMIRRASRDTVNFMKRIEDELFDNQENYLNRLMELHWKQDTLGCCLVPREMGSCFKCWGESQHDSETLYTVSLTTCANGDEIYLSPSLTTGSIEFTFRWYDADRLGTERFYRVLQQRFADVDIPNISAKQELNDPESMTKFVRINGSDWKTTLSTWQYRKYPRIHDVVLKMVLVNHATQSMIVDLKLLGVSRETSLAFCRKFMGALRWLD